MTSAPLRMSVRVEDWPWKTPLRIANRVFESNEVILVELFRGDVRGRGEGSPDGEASGPFLAQIEQVRPAVEAGATREELLSLLPAGAARNAIDCALWDLEAKESGRRAWELAGVDAPPSLTTAYTLSLDTPEAMAAEAARERSRPLFKLKLDGSCDLERVTAVRRAAPGARLIGDANASWTVGQFERLAPQLAAAGLEMIEQPLAPEDDAPLRSLPRPLLVGADESIHTEQDLARIAGCYDVLNLKLDKTGGLTAALALARRARSEGYRLMVGCMGATSLAMGPAYVLASLADYVDIDAPLLLTRDRTPSMRYAGSIAEAPSPEVWG